MAVLLDNRMISMILTLPRVKELTTLSQSIENLHQKSLSSFKNHKPPSIPIYQGSIIRIEKHHDKQNISDLIVRVPNFRHSSSSPSVTISTCPTNINELNERESQRETSFKRRAPICPIFNGSRNHSLSSNLDTTNTINNSNVNQTESNIRLTNTKRITIGLKNLSQTLTTNCKSKRTTTTTDINEITIIPALPDVEVITEDFQIPSSSSPKSNTKNQNLTSKFLTPKILSIKQKCCKIKRKQPSSNIIHIQSSSEDATIENSQTDINSKDDESNHEVKQESTQLKPKIPIILFDFESSSTHRYSTIPGFPLNSHNLEDISSTNNIQTDTFISKDNLDSSTDMQSSIPSHDDNIDETVYVVHPNGDTYSECYEVTYEFDPEFQQFLNKQNYLTEIENQFTEYQGLTNNYEQIQSNNNETNRSQEESNVYDDQTINNPSGLSSSQENEELLCLNEDYTVIIQLLKNVLQLERISNNVDEVNQQLGQINQTD
ncbi:unnamed protein product [Adineta steineri]|uniref:Uncharacterized protein n=1 Tax=Adineta steineri TaxID=433720 RepID=A0A813S3U3_9BILA|nr:unnamed protein product [Adineta steineri]